MVFVYIFKEYSKANFLLTCNQHCKTQRLLTVNWLRKFVRGAFGALLFNLHSITWKFPHWGLFLKKQPGEYRMIHHLSFPCGGSVNDLIPSELRSVHYASVDDAVKMIKKLGPNSHLAETDVRSAFRIIPVNPADYYLLGMHWKGNYYVDCCLPMGLASSCNY